MEAASSSGPDEHTLRQRERIEAYAILDTPREAVFDRIVFTAAQMFRVPIATISLIDGDRQWFKAQVGLGTQQLARHITFCEQVLVSDAVIVIEDATRDERFIDSPLVTGPPHLKFYAGAPLIAPDGVRVGSFCIGDRVAKTLSSRQVWQLGQLASSVIAMLEARRSAHQADRPRLV